MMNAKIKNLKILLEVKNHLVVNSFFINLGSWFAEIILKKFKPKIKKKVFLRFIFSKFQRRASPLDTK